MMYPELAREPLGNEPAHGDFAAYVDALWSDDPQTLIARAATPSSGAISTQPASPTATRANGGTNATAARAGAASMQGRAAATNAATTTSSASLNGTLASRAARPAASEDGPRDPISDLMRMFGGATARSGRSSRGAGAQFDTAERAVGALLRVVGFVLTLVAIVAFVRHLIGDPSSLGFAGAIALFVFGSVLRRFGRSLAGEDVSRAAGRAEATRA